MAPTAPSPPTFRRMRHAAPHRPRRRPAGPGPAPDGPAADELARRGAAGGLWALGANGLQLVLAVASTMLLARVLDPSDFGLFAMAMVAFALVAPLRDLGLPPALVQRAVVRRAELPALRRFNAAATLLLGALVVLAGLALAAFYDEPRVARLAPWLALALVLRGLLNVTYGLLLRAMAWRTLAGIELASYAAGAALGCVLALRGAGVGALIAQQLAWFGTQAALLHVAARRGRAPELASADDGPDGPDGQGGDGARHARRAAPGLRHYLDYARPVSGARLTTELVAQADRLALGRFADVATLGLYQNALRWASLPLLQLMLPLGSIATATLSRLADDPVRLRAAVRELFELVASLLVPLFAFLALAADPIVPLLLGERWIAAVPAFRLLALAMLFEGVDRVASWLHLALGHVGARLRWVLVASPPLALAPVLGALVAGDGLAPPGAGADAQVGAGIAAGVAAALLAARASLAVPALLWAVRGTALGARDALLPWTRPLAASLAGAGASLLVRAAAPSALPGAFADAPGASAPFAARALELAVAAVPFWTVYALAWLALPGGVPRVRRLAGLLRRRGPPSGAGPAPAPGVAARTGAG